VCVFLCVFVCARVCVCVCVCVCTCARVRYLGSRERTFVCVYGFLVLDRVRVIIPSWHPTFVLKEVAMGVEVVLVLKLFTYAC